MQVAYQGAQSLIQQMQQGAPSRRRPPVLLLAHRGQRRRRRLDRRGRTAHRDRGRARPDAAGQLSPPIPTQDGVWIIYLRDKRAGSNVTLVNLKQAAVPLAEDATPEQVEAAAVSLEALRPW